MSLIYTAENIRKWDEYTIQNEPISSVDLMERAAIRCCKKILGSYSFSSITVVCGKGNNGGDGLVISRILHERGFEVRVLIIEVSERSSKDFDVNLKRLPSGISVAHIHENDTFELASNLVVDCLFGSGLDRPIEGWIRGIVAIINGSSIPVIAIDIPSGLYVGDNSLNNLSSVIRANHTLSFQFPKLPFLFAEYAEYIGRFSVIDIGLHQGFKEEPIAQIIDRSEVSLRPLATFGHKGNRGYLTLIAGSDAMLGAALMASRAAFRTGCGYVGTMSPVSIIAPLATTLPEAIWIDETAENYPSKTTALAIGPGLGRSEKSQTKLERALKANLPIVIDADALNLLSDQPSLLKHLPKNAILTPHLGELHRLIGRADKPEALLEKQREFSVKYGVFVIQKGAFSKLTTPDGLLFVNTTGNSAMATAGMGDALTGIIGSFLAQGYSPMDAAKNGLFYHGLAGDKAIRKKGMHGLITSDIIDHIPAALNGL